MKRQGFTLIELMVVISVIGLLAAIAIPRFMNITKGAEIAQIKANKKNMETALAMYMVKEEKTVEDLFEDNAQKEEEFEVFYKYYEKNKLPNLPGTNRFKARLLNEGNAESTDDHNIGILSTISHLQLGWGFSRDGNIHPVVREDKYGIKWDKF